MCRWHTVLYAVVAVAVVVWAVTVGPASSPYRRFRRRRSLGFSERLVHEIVVPVGPDGRPGERMLASSRSPYIGVVDADGSRNDCAILIGPHGSVLLVVCLGRVEDKGTPKQSAIHTVSSIGGLGAGNVKRFAETDIVAGRLAERYMIEMNSGRHLLEWKFEQKGWLYGVGAALHPKDDSEQAEALGRAVLASWTWLNNPQEIAA
jgi:hypothetical protein